MSEWISLPDRLEASGTDLGREAADRIVDLEIQVMKLRSAIVGHRGRRDFMGGKEQCDLDLWAVVADVPWGNPVKGDG